jgi:hypothetical protein
MPVDEPHDTPHRCDRCEALTEQIPSGRWDAGLRWCTHCWKVFETKPDIIGYVFEPISTADSTRPPIAVQWRHPPCRRPRRPEPMGQQGEVREPAGGEKPDPKGEQSPGQPVTSSTNQTPHRCDHCGIPTEHIPSGKWDAGVRWCTLCREVFETKRDIQGYGFASRPTADPTKPPVTVWWRHHPCRLPNRQVAGGQQGKGMEHDGGLKDDQKGGSSPTQPGIGSTDPRPGAVTSDAPQWTGRASDVLRVMKAAGWISAEKAASQFAIANRIDGSMTAKSLSHVFEKLRRAGLIVATGRGARAGTYLTLTGIEAASRLPPWEKE